MSSHSDPSISHFIKSKGGVIRLKTSETLSVFTSFASVFSTDENNFHLYVRSIHNAFKSLGETTYGAVKSEKASQSLHSLMPSNS